MKKLIIGLLAAILPAIFIATPAFACTGVYVGSEASVDGTSMIARSNDYSPLSSPCYIKVYGGSDGEKITEIRSANGFVFKLPENFHRFTVIPTCEVCDADSFYTTATNDCGVSISATLTGYVCPEALAADPYVEGGIVEDMFPAVVGACASSAREGIELIAQIIDEKGSGEDNVIMIADQNECWYMEIYAGHQYCAMKAPDDCVCAMGNEFMIDTVDETSPDVICSKNLFNLPKEKGYAKYSTNGKMSLFDTYSGKDRYYDYSHLRTWGAHRILSPSTAGNYEHNKRYPLFYKPDNKVDVKTVMDIFRDRYEGTEYNPETTGRKDVRCIADEGQIRTHILQTYKDAPKELACVEWLSLSSAEFNTYVPISSCETKFDDTYTCNLKEFCNSEDNAYNCYKSLNANTAQNRQRLGAGVKAYWKFLENYSTKVMSQLMSEGNKDKINDFCLQMQKQSVYDAKRIKNEINWFVMQTDKTMEYSFHFSDLSLEKRKIPNYSPTVDAALVARLYNWNIEADKLQDHPGTYDTNKPGDKDQADNGGKEGYLKINKDGVEYELHSDNGHCLSNGKLNGEIINSYVDNGKTYADISFANKLINDEVKVISNNDISENRDFNKGFEWPAWATISTVAVVALILGLLIGRKARK